MFFYVNYPMYYSLTGTKNYYNFLEVPSFKKVVLPFPTDKKVNMWDNVEFYGYAFIEDKTDYHMLLIKLDGKLCLKYRGHNYFLPTESIRVDIKKGFFGKSHFSIYSYEELVVSVEYCDIRYWLRSLLYPCLSGLKYRGLAWDSLCHKYIHIVDSQEYRESTKYDYAMIDEWKNWREFKI